MIVAVFVESGLKLAQRDRPFRWSLPVLSSRTNRRGSKTSARSALKMVGPPGNSLVSSFLPRAAPGPATIKKPVGSAGASDVAVVVSAAVVSDRVRVVVSTFESAEVSVV